MKRRNALTKSAGAALSVAAALVLASAYNSRLAQAARQPQPRAASFGAITLGAGQTARLNVVNALLVQPEDATHDDTGLPAVQRVTLAFDLYAPEPATDDGSSRLVTHYRFLRRESQEVTLRPGEGTSFEMIAPEGTRLCAVVIGPPDARGQDGGVEDPNIYEGRGGIEDPNILTTLEVRAGGATAFVHPGTLRGFNPQPDPPGHQ